VQLNISGLDRQSPYYVISRKSGSAEKGDKVKVFKSEAMKKIETGTWKECVQPLSSYTSGMRTLRLLRSYLVG
jgi:hypothetical protein